MIKYSKNKFLHAEVDICVSREQFYKDINEAFSEIDKWRSDKEYRPTECDQLDTKPEEDDEIGRAFSDEDDYLRRSVLSGLIPVEENHRGRVWSWLLHRYSIGEISQE